MKKLLHITSLIIPVIIFGVDVQAACKKQYNPRLGITEYKCDSLNEYPDQNRQDDHDVNPDSWNRGHQAGADWAQKKGITNPNDCTGKSRSFVEGCLKSLK